MVATLQRCFDADPINALANDPAIRPFIGGDPSIPLDLTDSVKDRENVCLMGDHGGFLLIRTGKRVYEVHTMIRPEGRGQWSREAANMARDVMFDVFDAERLWTLVPREADNVRKFTEDAGLHVCGEGSIDYEDGKGPQMYDIYEVIR